LCSGLEEVDRSLQEEGFEYPLSELWTVNICLEEATLDDESEPKTDQIWMRLDLEATALESEYHDLCNFWSRQLAWSVSIETLKGTVIIREGAVVLLIDHD
jgi:hypothetical protein